MVPYSKSKRNQIRIKPLATTGNKTRIHSSFFVYQQHQYIEDIPTYPIHRRYPHWIPGASSALVCICTYPGVLIKVFSNSIMGCTMTNNIQKGEMPVIYELLGYTAILITLIGIIALSILRSGSFL